MISRNYHKSADLKTNSETKQYNVEIALSESGGGGVQEQSVALLLALFFSFAVNV